MEIRNSSLKDLREAYWNPNTMSEAMLARLKASLQQYGPVENLVVRPLEDSTYEVVSSNQRLRMLQELGYTHAPCLTLVLSSSNNNTML